MSVVVDLIAQRHSIVFVGRPFRRESMARNKRQEITVSVSPEKLARMDEAVERGAYTSHGQIVTEALDLWVRQQVLTEEDSIWLRREHEQGLASGLADDIDKNELLIRIKAEFRARG